MKFAYLVLGAEGSGTRWLTSWFIAAGCAGDGSHVQPFDLAPPTDAERIAWRRSLPYGGNPGEREWPDLGEMLADLDSHGYETRVLVVVRDGRCMEKSQVRRLLARDDAEARHATTRAYLEISRFVIENALDARWVTYESVLRDPAGFAGVLAEWGLMVREFPPAVDGNAKYASPTPLPR